MTSIQSIKRFYKGVTVSETEEGVFQLLLDGRSAKTPARNLLHVNEKTLAEAIAAEWEAQNESIELRSMTLTRLVMSALDLTDSDAIKIKELIINYLQTDLLCYFSDTPQDLRNRQEKSWRPFLAWGLSEGLDLKTSSGIVHVDQEETSIDVARGWIAKANDLELVTLARLTEMSGSALIACNLWRQKIDAQEAFNASRLDEMFQAEKWGIDAEAQTRADVLQAEFLSTARIFEFLKFD